MRIGRSIVHMFVLLLSVLAAGLPAADACAGEVTLVCDMRIEMSFGRFTTGADTVVVRGSFNGWSGSADALSDDDGDGIYEVTLDLTPGAYEYKFAIPLASHDRWEHSIDNRSVVASSAPVFVEASFFDHRAGWMPGLTLVGSDVSFTHQLLAAGAEYRVDGQPVILFEALADHGQQIVRLRAG